MPSLKETRLAHIQAILSGKKKVLHAKDVPARAIPNWPQLAVKNVYDEAMQLSDVASYLPDPTGSS